MDPFAEKDLIENLKVIASNLEGIKIELADLNVGLREFTASQLEEDGLVEPIVEFTEELDDDEDDEEEL